MRVRSMFLGSSLVLVIACGGSKNAPTTPATESSPSTTTTTTTTTITSSDGTSHESSTVKSADDEDVPSASKPTADAIAAAPKINADGSTALDVLLPAPATATGFPSATTNDKDCWRTVDLFGKLDKDYAALSKSCGTGTGMKEYSKRGQGKLTASHKRDVYALKMMGGYCYRFLVVGDDSMKTFDVRFQHTDGALMSMVGGKNGIAVIDPNEAWCKKSDRALQVVIEATSGEGSYVFGAWARPNKK